LTSPSLDALLDRLWIDYTAITPQAGRIHDLLVARGEQIVNDHIALRTFDLPGLEIEVLDRAFVASGYQPAHSYEFPDKKLHAYHYEHAEPRRPKIFISALHVNELSPEAGTLVEQLAAQMERGAEAHPMFASSGRHWQLDRATYERLAAESEYAAWVAAFGLRANHFTVSVNHLTTFPGIGELNDFLVDKGFRLNESGGVIKGSRAELLEQSSTLADEFEIDVTDGSLRVPSCYVEFARRYAGPDGILFQGFVTSSADRIFESTDRR
jgi:hypothetical protein